MVNLENELRAFGLQDGDMLDTLCCMGSVERVQAKGDRCIICYTDPDYGLLELERIPCRKLNSEGEILDILYSFRVDNSNWNSPVKPKVEKISRISYCTT